VKRAGGWGNLALLAALVTPLIALSGCSHKPATRPSSPPAAPEATPAKPAGRYSEDRDSTPGGPPPDVSKIPEPVPKAESPSQYGNKSPYTVLGETYRVLPDAKGYVERGIASWYGNKFHGYTTSTFEKYDMYAFSAAHKTLPLPSYARVTNLENGKSVVVRVNDRGPFVANRVIDLSYVAAVKLGVWPKGTAMVEVRAIDPAHPDALPAPTTVASHAPAAPAPEKTPKPALYLQVGAYSDRANAEHAAAKVKAAQLGDVRVVTATVDRKTVQRVRLGPIRDVAEADRLAPKIRALGLGEPRVAIED
jgi:rare lipoprotein A